MTTPSVERFDLTGRSFPTFHHPERASTELILVRHGQTEANINGLLVGRQDVLLTELGHRQAAAVAGAVAAQEADVLVCSPLQRARQTAAPIITATGLYPHIVDDLAEFSFGELEGWAEQDVISAHPHLQPLIEGVGHPDDYWPGGESANSFVSRILQGFHHILSEHQDRRVAVVTHGGVIGTFAAVLMNSGNISFFPYLVRNCSISTITVDAGGAHCSVWNQETHLATVDVAP